LSGIASGMVERYGILDRGVSKMDVGHRAPTTT
jgi:hypothetical protein